MGGKGRWTRVIDAGAERVAGDGVEDNLAEGVEEERAF
jgi:hypothetical protein